MKKLNVISLFWGIECGRIAMARLGWNIRNYYSAEVEPYPIKISSKNFPDIIHIWSVLDVSCKDWWLSHWFDSDGVKDFGSTPIRFDLLVWWSPCQDLSIAKSGGKWLLGEKSNLFFEYARILEEIREDKPDIQFLLENVASMKDEDRDEISRIMWVQPIMICSSLVSAQNRARLYWTNIPGVTQPKDLKIVLKDIIDFSQPHEKIDTPGKMKTKNGVRWDKSGKWYFSQQDRAYSMYGKHPNVPAARTISKVNFYNDDTDEVFRLNWDEIEKLQTLPVWYTDLGSENRIEKRGAAIWNGWTVDVIKHILSFARFEEEIEVEALNI